MIKSRPSYEGTSLEWALWYLTLGLLPLPIRSEVEVDDFMRGWARTNPEADQDAFDAARRDAGKHPGGPDGLTWRAGLWAARGVSEAQAREWFEAYPGRRIYLLTGPGSGLSVLDVDTYKGGDPTPWLPLATTVVRTPQGGLHLWWAERDGLKTTTAKVEGLDTRGKGGGVVAPSGSSTPGRTFERFAWPLGPCPDAVVDVGAGRRRRTPAAPVGATGGGTGPVVAREATPGRLLLHPPLPVETFASVVSTPRPDGTKTESAKLIVGMLCRRAPLPEDAIAAAMGLLDAWLGTWAGGAIVRAGWEQALRGSEPRGEAFVVEFVSLWNALRCDPKWPDDGESKSARQIAASLWRTSSASEQESAARPQLLLPAMPSAAVPPAPWSSATSSPTTSPSAPDDADDSRSTVVEVADWSRIEAGEGEATDPFAQHREALRLYAPTSAQLYTVDDVDVDQNRELLSCARLPHWIGADGHVDRSSLWGHGWGDWLDEFAGGGVCPGFMWVLVARRAKGGKTAFLDQHLTGLQMLGAQSVARGWGPIPQVWVVTEMQHRGLEQRGLARYIGVDQGIFRRGKKAELAPGVRELARYLKEAPGVTARRLFDRTREKIAGRDLWAQSRRWRHYVDTSTLPEEAQRGPALIEMMRQIVDMGRGMLAHDLRRDPADVWPVVVFDPIQRFGSGSPDRSGELPGDVMIEALRRVVDKDRWVACLTSDTNQASARAGATDTAKTPDAIVAQAIRGTYKVGHVPDLVLALDVLPLSAAERRIQVQEGRELEKLARVWVGLTRWSEGCDDPLPFRYFPRTGRFVASDPFPAPPAAPDQGDGTGLPAGGQHAGEPRLVLTPTARRRRGQAGA